MSVLIQHVAHESAQLHVTGAATFVDDLPIVQGTLYAALVLSDQAHGEIVAVDSTEILAQQGVVSVYAAEDIVGKNDCAPIMQDDPILAHKKVSYVGQPILIVVAKSAMLARKAAKKAKITYNLLPVVLSAKQAHQQQSYVLPAMTMQQGKASLVGSPTFHLQQSFSLGGQEHFYLEGQVARVVPKEDGCFDVFSSTQHPTEMQHIVAQALA